MIFDQSMPRITVECPDCGYHEAVYLVAPDDG
jgi:ribosomal protein S27E